MNSFVPPQFIPSSEQPTSEQLESILMLSPLQISFLLNSLASTSSMISPVSSSSSTCSSAASSSSGRLVEQPYQQQFGNASSLVNLMPASNMFDVALQLGQQQSQFATDFTPLPWSSIDRTKLFVGNLPDGTTLFELIELFKPYGHVNHRLSVVKDDNYAFVHFYTERAAELALHAVNGVWFRNRYLRVEYSVSNGHLSRKIEKST